jgi:hypothetical protein
VSFVERHDEQAIVSLTPLDVRIHVIMQPRVALWHAVVYHRIGLRVHVVGMSGCHSQINLAEIHAGKITCRL